MEEITKFLEILKDLVKPNPEAQRLRLANKQYKMSKQRHKREWRAMEYAEKEINRFEKRLSNDEDGYTDEDKSLIISLREDVKNKRIELIRANVV